MTKQLAIVAALVGTVLGDGKANVPPPEPRGHHRNRDNEYEVPPIPVCKDGTPYNPEVGCVYFDTAKAKWGCPHPYRMDHHTGMCVARTYGESTQSCPKGSYPHGHKCVTEITAPVEISCKHKDSVLTKDGCLRRNEPYAKQDDSYEPRWTCPHGYRMQDKGGVCVSSQHERADLVCEEGWELRGHHCVTVDLVPPQCEKGYTQSKGGCQMSGSVPPQPSCPRHSTEEKGQCYQKVSVKPIKVCEKGYTLNRHGRKCEARVMIQATPLDSKKKDAEVQYNCHGGELDDKGNCIQVITSHPVDVCEPGFELHGHKCVSVVPVEPEWKCPHHTREEKGQCITDDHKKPSCPHGYKYDEKTNLCAGTIKEKPASICPKGTLQGRGSRCVTADAVEPQPQCKHHDQLIKGRCVRPPKVETRDRLYKPVVDCPHGFHLDRHENVCTQKLSANVDPICEKGFVNEGHKCVAYHTMPPQPQCPRGYKAEGMGDKKELGCTLVSYERPTFICPPGTDEKHHKCYVYDKKGAPPVVKMPPPEKKQPMPQGKKEVPKGAKEVPKGKKEVPMVKKEVPKGKKEVPMGKKEVPKGKKEVPKASKKPYGGNGGGGMYEAPIYDAPAPAYDNAPAYEEPIAAAPKLEDSAIKVDGDERI